MTNLYFCMNYSSGIQDLTTRYESYYTGQGNHSSSTSLNLSKGQQLIKLLIQLDLVPGHSQVPLKLVMDLFRPKHLMENVCVISHYNYEVFG